MLHDIFSSLTHLVWTLHKKRGYHLCFHLFYVDGTDFYQYGDTITTYSISTSVMRSCDFGLSDPFLVFFWSIDFHCDLKF